MMFQPIPFEKKEDKVVLSGPVFLSCGCGGVTARWATLAQYLKTRVPQGKPKASKIIAEWMTQEGMREKYPQFTKHQYGMLVAETENGFEAVDVMAGATMKAVEEVGQLIRRHNEWKQSQ